MDEKRSTFAFRVTVALVVLPLLYVLAFGPAMWIDGSDRLPRWTRRPLYTFYIPMIWLWNEGPGPVRRLVRWYVNPWERSSPEDDV